MNNDLWNALSHFQTRDLVERAYERRHLSKPTDSAVWEITSCFIQAREYFKSASDAAEAVRPLLLYYGVKSLSRGITLVLGMTPSSGHGLKVNAWESVLGNPSGDAILDLKVIVQNGTFLDLQIATADLLAEVIKDGDGTKSQLPRPALQPKQVVTLDDVLSRIPQISSIYRSVTERPLKNLDGSVSSNFGGYAVYVAIDAQAGIETEDQVRAVFQVPADVEIGLTPSSPTNGLPSMAYRIEGTHPGAASSPRPVIEFSGSYVPRKEVVWHHGIERIIVPWEGGVYVPPILMGFLTSYVLGMLVRYFPARWMAIISGQKGDGMLPLLREAIDYVEREFPAMALKILQ